MTQIQRVRMAPPPGKNWNTVWVQGSSNVAIKKAAGWTIIEAHGEATVDAKANGMSTDAPAHLTERTEQVLGHGKPKAEGESETEAGTAKEKRRIGRPAGSKNKPKAHR